MNEHQRLAASKDVTWWGLGEASPALTTRWPEAMLQPPKPQIAPSADILHLAAKHDIEPEAGD